MNVTSVSNMVPVGPADLPSFQPLSDDQRTLIRAVQAVNASASLGDDHEITYTLDRAAHEVVVRLINKKTGNVMQQIPAEYVLKLAEELNKD